MAKQANIDISTIPANTGKGNVSSYYRWRTLIQYVILVGLASLGWIKLQNSAGRAACLGVIFPGGAYLANPNLLNVALFTLTVVFMPVTFFMWFGSGAILAPILNHICPIAIGAYLNKDGKFPFHMLYVVLGLSGVTITFFYVISVKLAAQNRRKRDERNLYLPELVSEVFERTQLPADKRELDLKTLRFVQYFMELGLQDIDDWSGFNIVDQFQTSSLRYQLYEIAYCLGTYQCIYTPSMRGKLSEAQTKVIDKSLTQKVMNYWKWESLFGHFSTNYDPVEWDNIMVTGYILKALGIYTNNTGDMRYTQPDCMEFVINNSNKFKHDIHSINKYLLRNWESNPYTVFPCEPNWIYSPCNLYGSAGSIAYDAAFHQKNFEKKREKILSQLQEDLSDELGTLVPIKSSLTGMTIPGFSGPTCEAFSAMDLVLLDEAAGVRSWVILREEHLTYDQEALTYKFKDLKTSDKIDLGNYNITEASPAALFAMVAAEHGDEEISQKLIKRIDNELAPLKVTSTGSYYNEGLSTWLTGFLLRGRLCRFRDWTRTIAEGPSKQCKLGPLLEGYDFQNVLVARAYSNDGTDLDLVLYNGGEPGKYSIRLGQLVPGAKYKYEFGTFEADDDGSLVLSVDLDGRTPIHIEKV